MGGIYLEDIAVWVKTQKGSILRGVMCLVILLITGFTVWKGFSEKDVLAQTIIDNDAVLAQDEYDIALLDKTLESLGRNTDREMFTPSDNGGGAIAYLQTKYAGHSSEGEAMISEQFEKIRSGDPSSSTLYEKNGLRAYTANEILCNPWFDMPRVKYSWSCVSRQSVVIDNEKSIPSVFLCRFGNGPYLAVTVGVFDLETGRLNSASVYTLYPGRATLDLGREVRNISSVNSTPGDLLNYSAYDNMQQNWKNGYKRIESDLPEDAGGESEILLGENDGVANGTPSGDEQPGDEPPVEPDFVESDIEESESGGGFDLGKFLEGLMS